MSSYSINHSSPPTSIDVLLPHPLNHVESPKSSSLKRTRSPSLTKDDATSEALDPTNKKARRKRNTIDIDQSLGRHLSADKLYIYPWPSDEPHADLHVLQEQICDYLSLKSFKRKYPDICRRMVDLHEREYLKSQNVVTESQCDLGLTALKLDEVLELMSVDYPEKCHQFNHVWQQKRRTLSTMNNQKSASNHQSTENSDKTRSTKLSNTVREELVRSAMEYNTQLQKERVEERKACFDLQTMQVHLPSHRQFRLPKDLTRIGSYPLALVPGQYQDSYRKYHAEELKYMPINTALYYYPKPITLVQSERFSQQGLASDEEEEEEKQQQQQQHKESPSLLPNGLSNSSQSHLCHICKSNHENTDEEFVQCTSCQHRYHPACIEVNSDMLSTMKTYAWQCNDCKSCGKCSKTHDEANMMFCDRCDRGYHSYCVGLESIPDGSWQCSACDPPNATAGLKSKRGRPIHSPSVRLSLRRQRSTPSDASPNSPSLNLLSTRPQPWAGNENHNSSINSKYT